MRFEPGVTVIVGPNGSGKSNITDGVLWALGEQSAKTLRGSSMEDVIFSGSADRKALGAAEVSLTFDNSDGAIPIDFSEVTMTRRLYRSGESEYLLNRNPCRLIDIQEMISDSGLGREMYSVISQGRLDDVLNSKPQDRRQLLEAAAGVLKHKRRRDRALRKMKAMEQNLTRGKDILREVNRQLAPLQKQADTAREHERLLGELKEAQIAGAVGRLRRLRVLWEELAGGHEERVSRIEELNDSLVEAQTSIDQLEAELEAKGDLTGDISEYRRRFAALMERINSGLLLLEEKGKNLVARLSELRQSIHSLERRAKEFQQNQATLLAERDQLDADLADLYKRLNRERREVEEVKKAAKKAVDALQEAQAGLEKTKDKRTELERELNYRRSLIESTTEKISFLCEQAEALAQKTTTLTDELERARGEKARLEADLPDATSRVEESAARIMAAQDARERAVETQEHTVTDLSDVGARMAALEAVEANTAPDLDWFEEAQAGFPSISGSLAAQMKVEPRYERALEAVLGLDLHALVATERVDAIGVFRHARGRGDDPVRVLAPVPLASVAAPAPDLTRAVDIVDCSDSVRPAIESLLSLVWIAEDIDSFIDQGTFIPAGGVVVDERGDYLDGRGIIVRHSSTEVTSGSLATRRELALARRESLRLTEQAELGKVVVAEAEKATREAQDEAVQAQTEAQRLDGRIVAAAMRVQNVEREVEHLGGQEQEVGAGLSEKRSGLLENESVVARIEIDIQAAQADLKGQTAARDQEQVGVEERTEDEKAAMARLTEAQVEMASLAERQVHLKSRIINVTDELKRAEATLVEQEKIVAATEELRHRIQPVHSLYTELRLAAELNAGVLADQDESEQAGAAAARAELRVLHQRARELNADLNLANSELLNKAEKKTQVEAEVSQTTRFLVDELGVALETALSREPVESREPEDWAVREQRLRDRIQRMGPVNQIAAGEFTKLEERQEFLTKQMDDLVRSQKALRKVIKAIDEKISDRFEETFKEVNENFNQVFQELFPGGRARLVLTDDSDEEGESGVDLEAQPEGKRLASLSLLSGGERSLVGLALLFALHYSRPSPFYILDEVEAALDVVNLGRFIRLIKKLGRKTQFLVITHQRLTMEVADSVYGVSMQADGVSKVISQKLNPEESADERTDEGELVAAALRRSEEVTDEPKLPS